jgi:hypothetical protein
VLLKNDLELFPIDHILMTQKEHQDHKRDILCAEYLIVTYLVYFLGSNTHKKRLNELQSFIEKKLDSGDRLEEEVLLA